MSVLVVSCECFLSVISRPSSYCVYKMALIFVVVVVTVLTVWVSVTSSFCNFMRGHQRRLCFAGKSTQSECDVHLCTCNTELLVLHKTDLNSVVCVWHACFFRWHACVCLCSFKHACASCLCLWLCEVDGRWRCVIERNRLSFICSTILAGALLFLCVAPSLLKPYPASETDWLLLLF